MRQNDKRNSLQTSLEEKKNLSNRENTWHLLLTLCIVLQKKIFWKYRYISCGKHIKYIYLIFDIFLVEYWVLLLWNQICVVSFYGILSFTRMQVIINNSAIKRALRLIQSSTKKGFYITFFKTLNKFNNLKNFARIKEAR